MYIANLTARNSASDIFKEIEQDSDSISVTKNLNEIESLLSKAEEHYQKAHNENPNDEELTKLLVSFYQNTASKYQRILPSLQNGASNSVEEKITTYLKQSIPLYKSLLAGSPDNDDIRNNLFLTYSYLGMDKEAQELK